MNTRNYPLKLKDKGFEPIYSLEALKTGLETLNTLWEAGYTPDQFRLHHHLTWYALQEGNLVQCAKVMKTHRNTLLAYFFKVFKKRDSLTWRITWHKIKQKYPREPLEVRFSRFWKIKGFRPKLADRKHEALIGLWKTGFPYKLIKASFWLWAHKTGNDREWILKKLNISHRNVYIYLGNQYKKKDSMTYHWFAPYKTTPLDWQPIRRRGRPMKERSDVRQLPTQPTF